MGPVDKPPALAMGEIDALSDAALRLIASIEPTTAASDALSIRRRAMRLVELAQRMERDGGSIMSPQPSWRAAFTPIDCSLVPVRCLTRRAVDRAVG